MASSVATTGTEKVAELQGLGADAFVLDTRQTGANADSVIRRLESATGFWFSGGDQNRIMASLAGSRAARAISAAYARGAVIGGTSAGAAAMSSMMITGDERRLGGRRPPSDSSQAYITIDRDNVVTATGLGFISGAIVDQHFVRRKRQNRLVSLVLENPSLIGVGIDEATAIVVRPDGTWDVIGESVAVIFDARRSAISSRSEPLGASGIQMHVLPSGSRFDPAKGRVLRVGSGGPR
jgi:cyanophycinase